MKKEEKKQLQNQKVKEAKKAGKTKKAHTDWEFSVVKYVFVLLFLALVAHFVNFQMNESEEFINNDYNSREELFAKRVVRGDIISADGQVLAETVINADGIEKRNYPFSNLFAHVVGYATNGKAGIEKLANFYLLKSHVSAEEKVEVELAEQKYKGDNVITTLNYKLQQVAYDGLSWYEGAVVVLEPSTGKILAMVSKPNFDPNLVEEEWEYLVSEENTSTVLLNRATQGLYPPGSTFKIVTTLAHIRQNMENSTYAYVCTGKLLAGGSIIHCYKNKSHGTVDLEESFAESCNASYANIGLNLEKTLFQNVCDSLLFNKDLPTKFPYSKSSFVLNEEDDEAVVMQNAIGQGTTLVTPFHMALITSAIANNGVLMNPYVIDRIESHTGEVVKSYVPSEYGALLTVEETTELQGYMEAVVDYGTGTKLQSKNYDAYGKTGSAEFSAKAEHCHSWFVGYAHAEGKNDIAIAVLVEEAGSGSTVAVPIAKKIFDAYYSE